MNAWKAGPRKNVENDCTHTTGGGWKAAPPTRKNEGEKAALRTRREKESSTTQQREGVRSAAHKEKGNTPPLQKDEGVERQHFQQGKRVNCSTIPEKDRFASHAKSVIYMLRAGELVDGSKGGNGGRCLVIPWPPLQKTGRGQRLNPPEHRRKQTTVRHRFASHATSFLHTQQKTNNQTTNNKRTKSKSQTTHNTKQPTNINQQTTKKTQQRTNSKQHATNNAQHTKQMTTNRSRPPNNNQQITYDKEKQRNTNKHQQPTNNKEQPTNNKERLPHNK